MAGRTLRTVLFALATAFVVSTPAKAAQWIGKFDPLSVFGQGLFQYGDDPSCTGPGTHLFDAVCDPMILSLTATITDDNGTATTSDDSHAFLDFASILPHSISSYVIDGAGQLRGVNTDVIGFVFPTSCDGPNASSLCGPWWFQWISDFNFDPVMFFQGECFVDGDFQNCFPNQTASVQSTEITFTQVPEPATLGLLLGGLGAAWLGRRRRRSG